MSFQVAYAMRKTSNTSPICWAISLDRSPKGRPKMASQAKKNKCPPSRMGMGNKFKIPKLILKIAISHTTLARPCSACSPETVAIMSGPPRCFDEISPVKHLHLEKGTGNRYRSLLTLYWSLLTLYWSLLTLYWSLFTPYCTWRRARATGIVCS